MAAVPFKRNETRPKIILNNDWSPAGFIPYLLALDAGWDVLGLVGDTANTWALQTSLHGLATLEAGNLSSCIPVHKGSDYPLLNNPESFQLWQDLRGPLVWQGAFAPENLTAEAAGADPTSGDPNRISRSAFVEGYPNTTLAGTNAAAWMIEQVRANPGEVYIYAGGALTNIAMAVRMDPQFASLTKGLVIMGGYLDVNLLQVTGSELQADINGDVSIYLACVELSDTFPRSTFKSTRKEPRLLSRQISPRLVCAIISCHTHADLLALVSNAANQVFPDQAFLDEIAEVKNPYSSLMHDYYGTSFPFWDEIALFSILDEAHVLNSTSCKIKPRTLDTANICSLYRC